MLASDREASERLGRFYSVDEILDGGVKGDLTENNTRTASLLQAVDFSDGMVFPR